MSIAPLHGLQTHPLTTHSRAALKELSYGPLPAGEFNAGVINRLMRELLIEIEDRPSPYKTGKGKLIRFAVITPAGRAALVAATDPQ